ncbi:MAG: DNA recombination protein RmuC [Patescibacteria group bacterium]|nr:DNA recombination protein RmuC [Patescibacteria group bacterium]
MDIFSIIIILILIAGFTALFWQFKKNQQPEEKPESMLLLQNQLSEMRKEVDGKLSESSRQMQNQFTQSLNVIKGVTEKVVELQETNKQVVGFTEQLKNLEKVLTNSKNRGSLGEAGLEMILNNILPPQAFEMQYHFKNGEAVDAVVKIKDNLLPVDAKFSLENYRRIIDETDPEKKSLLEKSFKDDLKKRIDETAKYIRPQEGTLDFAFMYIPAEGIYYDLLVNEVGSIKANTRSLIDYAFNERKVVIVSPTTFAAYLQTVLQGLRALKIEKDAKEIQKNVEKLQKHLLAYDEYFKKVGNNLATTVNAYNSADKELQKIDKDVVKITGGESQAEILQLDKPKLKEE